MSKESYIKDHLSDLNTPIKKLSGGINSETYKFIENGIPMVIKFYGKNIDFRERIHRESMFLNFLQTKELDNVPRLIEVNESQGYVIMTFLNGGKFELQSSTLLEIMKFIRVLNNENIDLSNFLYAKDAFIYFTDLISDVANRSSKLLGKSTSKKLESKIYSFEGEINKFIEEYLKYMLSPSDIGPQNMMYDGQYVFFDFEYSGIDSNIKLALDMITHPDLKFNEFRNFDIELAFQHTFGFGMDVIPDCLIRIFTFKWLLIRYKRELSSKSYFSLMKLLFLRYKLLDLLRNI
jgi:thiamine kinase-like enzyme